MDASRDKQAETGEDGDAPGSVHMLNYAFNQDGTNFVVGTTAGFRVYNTSPVYESCRREFTGKFENRSVQLAEMLFRTDIFAMATTVDSDPFAHKKVLLWSEKQNAFRGELKARTEVKGIALRRDIIVMVCEYAIYVYSMSSFTVIQHLTTIANNKGLCVLAAASEPWILCCPGQSIGSVRVQVGTDSRATHVFDAHKSGLAAIAVNTSGKLIATGSESGTVVKVFLRDVEVQLLYRLRRSTWSVNISCLSFSHDDQFCALASSTSTVHIFKLDANMAVSTNGPESVTDVVKGVIPTFLSDLRAYAQFRIPDSEKDGQPSIDVRSTRCTNIVGPLLAFHKTEPRLSVLHYNGAIYECEFNVDHDPGHGTQDCTLHSATTFFAVRPDFKVQGSVPNDRVTEPVGFVEEGDDCDEWQVL